MRRATVVASTVISAASTQRRDVTARGQFNPIHTFEETIKRRDIATSLDDFKVLITNPGPLRITYSPDYVDWYYRAYQDKASYAEKKAKALKKIGNGVAFNTGAPELGIPAGMFLRPASSLTRQRGEETKKKALQAIEKNTTEHGMMDVLERQPQFPAVHIDRCTPYHVRQFVNELVVDHALSADSVWEKALMYRALLAERRQSYPQAFQYIFDAIDSCVFATKQEDPHDAKKFVYTNADKYPTEEMYQYYAMNVKKYHIENAVDAHVFLQCHRLPEAEKLLFTQPPPKEPADGTSIPPRPSTFPPLTALLQDEGNLYLLKTLLFAELNTFVSIDPFVKFPAAAAVVQRPKFEHGALAGLGVGSLSQVVKAKRGDRFAELAPNASSALDARGNDIARLQRAHTSSDLQFGNKELPKLAESDPAAFAQNGFQYLNPRTVRAEIRDVTTRKVLSALRTYQKSQQDIFRHGYDLVRTLSTVHAVHEQRLPAQTPTIPHFLAIILQDTTISFILSTCENKDTTAAIQTACRQLARQLFTLSMEYHVEQQRRVNRQKYLVFSAVLDNLIAEERARMLGESSESCQGRSLQLRRIPEYVPFASRALEENGFPSEAKFVDYQRWMRPPQ